MSDLYNRIESLCRDRGINISEMCRRSGAARGSLTDLKKGRKASLSTDTMRKIATYFDVPIEYLLGDDTCMQDRESAKKEPTVMDDELSRKQLMLIDFARSVPADKVDLVLKLMQTIVEDDG